MTPAHRKGTGDETTATDGAVPDQLTAAELEYRARWGGIGDTPVLTPSERTAWVLIQQARATWTPQAALALCLGHGRSVARPRRAQQ